jgi:hypothetical protein
MVVSTNGMVALGALNHLILKHQPHETTRAHGFYEPDR